MLKENLTAAGAQKWCGAETENLFSGAASGQVLRENLSVAGAQKWRGADRKFSPRQGGRRLEKICPWQVHKKWCGADRKFSPRQADRRLEKICPWQAHKKWCGAETKNLFSGAASGQALRENLSVAGAQKWCGADKKTVFRTRQGESKKQRSRGAASPAKQNAGA